MQELWAAQLAAPEEPQRDRRPLFRIVGTLALLNSKWGQHMWLWSPIAHLALTCPSALLLQAAVGSWWSAVLLELAACEHCGEKGFLVAEL